MSQSTENQVVIVGGGIASLATGILLHERMPRARIRLYTDMNQDLLGGHLLSWDEGGFAAEHGFHVLFGFYEETLALLDKTGVMENLIRSPNHSHILHRTGHSQDVLKFTPWNPLAYRGFSLREKWALTAHYLKASRLLLRALVKGSQTYEELDAIDFRTWSLQRGTPPSVVQSGFYDQFYAAAFNDPHELSTFVALQSVHGIFSKPWHYYFKKPSREALIEPLARYFVERCGGEIHYRSRLERVDVPVGHNRIAGLVIRDLQTGEEEEIQADSYVLALGLEDLKKVDLASAQSHPYFASLRGLQTVSSISLQAWFRHDPVPASLDTFGGGFSKPFVVVCPISKIRGTPSHPQKPHELIAVGPEAGFEEVSDAELISRFLSELQQAGFRFRGKVPPTHRVEMRPEASGGATPGGVSYSAPDAHFYLRRNSASAHRYLLTRPGEWHSRPGVESPFENLFMSGAWVKTRWGLPCVESAVCSAKEASARISDQLKNQMQSPYIPRVPRGNGTPSGPVTVQGESVTSLDKWVVPPPFHFPDSTGNFFLLPRNPEFSFTLPAGLRILDPLRDRVLLGFFQHRQVFAMRDPTETRYDYSEVLVSLFVQGEGKRVGLFPLTLYLDDDTAVAAGREIYGFPKKWAQFKVSEGGMDVQRKGRRDFQSPPGAEWLPVLSGSWETARPLKGASLLRRVWGRVLPRTVSQAWSESMALVDLPIYNHLRVFDSKPSEDLVLSRVTCAKMKNFQVSRGRLLRNGKIFLGESLQDPLRDLIENQEGVVSMQRGVSIDCSFEL